MDSTDSQKGSFSTVSCSQLAPTPPTERSTIAELFKKKVGRSPISKISTPVIGKRGKKRNVWRAMGPIPEVTEFKAHLDPRNTGDRILSLIYICPLTNEMLFFKYQYTMKKQGIHCYKCEECFKNSRTGRIVHVTASADYFLEDPSALEHVCLTGQRIRSQPQSLAVREPTPAVNENVVQPAPHQEKDTFTAPIFDMETIHMAQDITTAEKDDVVPGVEQVQTEWREMKPRPLPPCRFVPTAIAMRTITRPRPLNAVPEEGEVNPEVQSPSAPTGTSMPHVQSLSAPTGTSVPQPSTKSRHSSYMSLVELALDGLDPAFELQYQNDLMRFIYSDLQRKYGLRADAII